jgi:hypothetical protein
MVLKDLIRGITLSIFEIDFKLRFREVSMSWNQGKLIGKSWKLGIWWNFANKLLVVPSFKEKYVPSKYGSRIWIPLKVEFGLISW